MSDEITRETVLVIPMRAIPPAILEGLRDRPSFANGVYLKLLSEFEPYGEGDWSETLTQAQVESYYADQKTTNGFEGSLDDFIAYYALQPEMWLLSLKLDLKGIDNILFHISW